MSMKDSELMNIQNDDDYANPIYLNKYLSGPIHIQDIIMCSPVISRSQGLSKYMTDHSNYNFFIYKSVKYREILTEQNLIIMIFRLLRTKTIT